MRRNLFGGVLTCGWMVAVPLASSLTEFGGGSLDLRTEVAVVADSNIYANSAEVDDWIVRLRPSVEFVRNSGLLRADFEAYLKLLRYDKYSEENADDYGVRLQLSYPQRERAPLQAEGTFRFAHETAPNPDVGEILETDFTDLRVSLLSQASEKFSARGRFAYDHRRARSATYRDTTLGSVDVALLYGVSPKTRILGGFGYTDFEIEGTTPADGDARRIFVGAQGDFTPKLQGEFRIGQVERRFRAAEFSSRDAFLIDGSLTWQAGNKTSLSLSGARTFDLTPTNVSFLASTFRLGARHVFSAHLSGRASVGYGTFDYRAAINALDPRSNRSDDEWRLGLGLDYRINAHFSTAFDLVLTDRGSDLALYGFDRSVVTWSVVARF